MRNDCLDTDALVSVAAALEWDVPARLEHLAACERCRGALKELTQLRSALADLPAVETASPADVPSGAKELVAGPALMPTGEGHKEAPAPAGAAGRRRADAVVAAATFLAAGATAFLLVLLLTGGRGTPLGLAAAAAVGLASVLPARRPFRGLEA